MLFEKTALSGVYIIKFNLIEDQRGFFTRSFCKKELEKVGLQGNFPQCNISYNHKRGTIRGLHYQSSPYEEEKIILCTSGSIYDVVLDIRKNSATYGKWIGIKLIATDYQALYIPKGFAHGFQTLSDKVEVFYFMGNFYCEKAASGIRWDDPYLNIKWPNKKIIISEKDKYLPRFML